MRAILILLATITIVAGQTFDTRLDQAKRAAFFRLVGAQELWTPADLGSDLVMWLESDRSDLQEITDGSVYKWTNSPPAPASFTTASGNTPARRADIVADDLNGYDTLNFYEATFGGQFRTMTYSGLSDLRNAPGFTTFVLHKLRAIPTSLSGVVTYRTDVVASRWSVYLDANRTYRVVLRRANADAGSDFTTATNQASITTNAWAMYSAAIDFSDRNLRIYADGSSVATVANFSSAGALSSDTDSNAVLINNPYYTPKIAQIITLRTGATLAEIQKLEGWAAHRYALTANLPSNHPWKNTPPTK